MAKKIEINYKKIEEIFGRDFNKSSSFEGATSTRNNEMFSLITSAIDGNFDECRINIDEEFDDRYSLDFFSNGLLVKKGGAVKWKSISSRLHDIGILDPAYFELLLSSTNKIDLATIHIIREYREISLVAAKENFKLLLNENGGSYESIKATELFHYWKKIDKEVSSSKLISKVYLAMYMVLKDIAGINIDYINAKIKTNRIKILVSFMNTFLHNEIVKMNTIKKNMALKESDLIKNETKTAFTKTIKEVIQEVKDGTIEIPVFQRDYIWSFKQVCALLQSLTNKLPIGSLLLAETNRTFGNKNKIVKAIYNKNNSTDQKTKLLILDGQQRLTSILLSIFPNTINHELSKSASNKVDINKTKKVANDIYIFEDKFWLKKELSDYSKAAATDENKLINNEEKIYEKMKDYELSIIKVDGYEISKLIDVFEKINIGSTRLNNIDLMHAAFLAHDHEYDFLTELKTINANDKVKNFGFKKEQIVNIWKLFYDIKYRSEKVNYKNSELLKLAFDEGKAKNWMIMTSIIIDKLVKVIDFLANNLGFHNNTSLPNDGFLMLAATIVFLEKSEDEYKKILKRVVLRTIDGDYAAGTATKVMADLNSFLEKTEYINELSLDSIKEKFSKLNYKKRNGFYKLVIGLLSLSKPLSLIDGITPVISLNNYWETASKDQHHFLPSKNHDFVQDPNIDIEKNKIQNIFIIDTEENREVIKTRNPFDYLLCSCSLNKDALKKFSESHFINVEDVKNIIENRESPKYESIQKIWKNRESKIWEKFQEKYLK